MGPYRGGQAQYIKVPYADFNALLLPPGNKNEADFIVCAILACQVVMMRSFADADFL